MMANLDLYQIKVLYFLAMTVYYYCHVHENGVVTIMIRSAETFYREKLYILMANLGLYRILGVCFL